MKELLKRRTFSPSFYDALQAVKDNRPASKPMPKVAPLPPLVSDEDHGKFN